MPFLKDPAVRYRDSFLAAAKEFPEDREHGPSWFVTDIDDEALYDEAAFLSATP